MSNDARTLHSSSPGREPALRGWLDRHGTLMAAAEADPAVVRLEGRGRVALVPAPAPWSGERWVVRHYHRGGAMARILGDRYVRVGTPRPLRELRLLEAVRTRGVPAPEPLGAAVYRAGPFYRGDLVTRWVPDSVDLATLLFGPGPGPGAEVVTRVDASVAMAAAGRLVNLLHRRGVEHRDLNLKNILVVGSAGGVAAPESLVLDLDRARLHSQGVPRRRRRVMIARFWRSVRKWERRTGRILPASLRSAFDAGYAEGPAALPAG